MTGSREREKRYIRGEGKREKEEYQDDGKGKEIVNGRREEKR